VPAYRDERLGTHVLGGVDVVGAEVAGVGGDAGRDRIAVVDDALEHRLEVLGVRGLVADRRRDDDLMVFVDRDLGVVRLEESTVAQHDPAVRIGEVALCGWLRCAIGIRRRRVARQVVVGPGGGGSRSSSSSSAAC
jgi:hypothetical protein